MESSKPGANNHHEFPDNSDLRRVGDREANIYDVFVDAQTAPYGVLVRSARDRCLVDPEGYLWAAMESTDILGTVEVGSAQGGTAHPTGHANPASDHPGLTNSHGSQGRQLGHSSGADRSAQEINPATGITPIRWFLLITFPVEHFLDAQRVLRWYTYRWRIERLHFIFKTGRSHVEKLQLETFDRLRRAIALDSIMA